jgi:hypothetical protein
MNCQESEEINHNVESVVESVVDLDSEPVSEPVIESVVDLDSEPKVEPVIESVVDLDSEPKVEPVIESVVDLDSEPGVAQIIDSASAVETEDESVVEKTQNIKPYRAHTYDIYDEKYANQMRTIYCPNIDKFNEFTDNLMNDVQINRNCLLDAIDDYKRTKECRSYPLTVGFEDSAFNYRPYQPGCMIC